MYCSQKCTRIKYYSDNYKFSQRKHFIFFIVLQSITFYNTDIVNISFFVEKLKKLEENHPIFSMISLSVILICDSFGNLILVSRTKYFRSLFRLLLKNIVTKFVIS